MRKIKCVFHKQCQLHGVSLCEKHSIILKTILWKSDLAEVANLTVYSTIDKNHVLCEYRIQWGITISNDQKLLHVITQKK